MKYSKKRSQYEASNVTFSEDEMRAMSYGWWQFVALIDGKVVFNGYNYSPSTCKHQLKVRRLLETLGIKVDVVVYSSRGFQSSDWKETYIKEMKSDIETLKEKMTKKGTHKATNESRQLQINLLEMRCEQITRMIYGTKLEQHLYT